MTAPASPTPPHGVPNELIDQMHETNEKLGAARHHREEADAADFDIGKKRDQASEEIRQMERRLEQIDAQIIKELKKP